MNPPTEPPAEPFDPPDLTCEPGLLLLDITAGWMDLVSETREGLARGPRAWMRSHGPATRAEYDDSVQHYSEAYLDTVAELHHRAANEVLQLKGDPPKLPASEFVRRYLIPILEQVERDWPGPT